MILVVPCYNEEKRLPVSDFVEMARTPGLSLLFVNDGSKDGTARVLDELCARTDGKATTLSLERNSGKGEAVRRGLLEALARGADVVAFADSDLATPPDEIMRVIDPVRAGRAEVSLGARVALAGTDIDRTPLRHHLGRVFATGASLVLQARIYDTQCGAKAFKSTPLLRAALATRFRSRWAFDVELLARLLDGAGGEHPLTERAIVEVPLRVWRDVAGSKLTSRAMARAGLDLVAILRSRRRR